jgi:hypothetical protein
MDENTKRKCNQCKQNKTSYDFSNNQWNKGEESSRCRACITGFICDKCSVEFNTPNELKMHMQCHRERCVDCPFCVDAQFMSIANAYMHAESGQCTECYGKENAREQIYDRVHEDFSLQRFLNEPDEDMYASDGVPEFPYTCYLCHFRYRDFGPLLQHLDHKHGTDHQDLPYDTTMADSPTTHYCFYVGAV